VNWQIPSYTIISATGSQEEIPVVSRLLLHLLGRKRSRVMLRQLSEASVSEKKLKLLDPKDNQCVSKLMNTRTEKVLGKDGKSM
jgi:hypothetical protein